MVRHRDEQVEALWTPTGQFAGRIGGTPPRASGYVDVPLEAAAPDSRRLISTGSRRLRRWRIWRPSAG